MLFSNKNPYQNVSEENKVQNWNFMHGLEVDFIPKNDIACLQSVILLMNWVVKNQK